MHYRKQTLASSTPNHKAYNPYMNIFFRYATGVMGLVFIDQITKAFFASRDFLFGPIKIHLVKNYGMPFNLDFGQAGNLAVVILVFGLFIFYCWQNYKNINLAVVVILSGALSNIVDRIALGYVRDFINVGLPFTFNLADVFVVG